MLNAANLMVKTQTTPVVASGKAESYCLDFVYLRKEVIGLPKHPVGKHE